MAGKIFINHRRLLSETDAEVLFKHLETHFPTQQLFIDRRALDKSTDWKKQLKEEVHASEVMVVVIGDGRDESWLDITYPVGHPRAGQRRLDDPEDLVRYEIVEAIDRGIPLVPVLVNGAHMPPRDARLPLDLWPLTKPQGSILRTRGGVKPEIDVAEIAKVIEARLSERRRPARTLKRVAAGVAVIALPVGALIGLGAADWIGPRADIGALRREVAAFKATAETETKRAAGLDATAEDLRLRLDQASADLDAATKAAGAPAKALTDARAENARLTAARDAALREAREASGKLDAAEKAAAREREVATARVAALQKELTEARTEAALLPALRERLGKAEADAKAAEARATDAGTALTAAKQRMAELEARPGLGTPSGRPLPPRAAGPSTAIGTVHRDRLPDGSPCAFCPDLVPIPGGRYTRGSPKGEGDAAEQPERRVDIKPFHVGKFEVTFDQWDACFNDGGCKERPSDRGWGRIDRPVINVSWDEITKEYLPWLNKRLGLTGAAQYRLLTEAEWEYVARNGQPRRYVFGDDEKGLGDYAWFSANAGGRTQKVGQKGASEWGVHDIHGNVWEWVQDCHAANYDAAPVDGSAAKDTPGCSRVLRGGSWDDYPQLLRSAIRVRDLPVDRDDFLGFRLARTLNP